MTNNYDIFISYKRKSLPTANNLYYRLTTRGYSTFFDLEEMGRDNFNVQLLNYIENAKDVFVILEEGSLDACKREDWERDWFCHEIAFALEKKKNIIPILLNGYTMPLEDFFPDKLKELSLKNAPEFNFSFFEAYLDKLAEKEYLISKPNLQEKESSVFKFYSNENCQVFKEGKMVCSLEGMSDEPFFLPVPRKGDYRFRAVNEVTGETKQINEYIETNEEKNIDITWEDCIKQTKYDVFISYSRKDYVDDSGNVIENNMLSKIKDTLKANGISYWFDEEGIYSSDEFASVLTNAIRNSRIFLFISSVNSNQSKWTSNEISTALEFKKPIIPLRLDKSPYNDSVMMKIVSFDYIECKEEEKAISKLLRAIRHHIPDNNQIDSRLFEIPQSVKGATVIMDIGDKKVEHIMSFESSSLKHKTSDSIINHIHLEEIVDSCDCFRPNDISICVADRKTPIVLLIGPAGVGKTMTLVRLARYLSEIGYSVCPDRTFRSVSDQGYNKLCDSFQDLINGAYAAPGTRLLDCLLVKILKEGRNILQIVDFAGEVFMDFDSNMAPSYLYQLLNLDNPIIWVIMIEPYWADMNSRRGYVEKIRELKRQYISSKDKTIIIVNKIDKTPFLESKSIIDRKGVFNHIRMEYPELMEIFLNVSPFFKFFKPYDCTLVPFMSGRYTSRDDGPLLYVPSSKEFPQTLWNELIKK